MKKNLKPDERKIPDSGVGKSNAEGLVEARQQEESKTVQNDNATSTASPVTTAAMAAPAPPVQENPKTKAAWDSLINAELVSANITSTSFDQLERYQQGTANAVNKMVEAVSIMVMAKNKDPRFSQLMNDVLVQAANARVGLKDIEDFIVIASDVHEVPNDKMLAVFHAELEGAQANLKQKYPNLPSIQETSQPPQAPPVRIGDSGLPTHIVARAYTEDDLGKQLAQSINNATMSSDQMNITEIKALSETIKAFKKTPFKNPITPELSNSLNALDKLLDKASRSDKTINARLANKIRNHLSEMSHNKQFMQALTAPAKLADISIDAALAGMDMPQLSEKISTATQTAAPPIPPPAEPHETQEAKAEDVVRESVEAPKPTKGKEEAHVEAIPQATAVSAAGLKEKLEKKEPVSTVAAATETSGQPLPKSVEPPQPSRPGLGLFPQFFDAVAERRNEIKEEARQNFSEQFPGKPLPSRGKDIKLGFIDSIRYGYSVAKKEMSAEKANIYLETGAPEASEFLKRGPKTAGRSFLSRESFRNFREMFRNGLSTVGVFLGSGLALTVNSITGGRGKVEQAKTHVEDRINSCQNSLAYIAHYLNGTGAQSHKSRVDFLGADVAKNIDSANMAHLDNLLNKVFNHLKTDRANLADNENLPALQQKYRQGLATLTKEILNEVSTTLQDREAAKVLSDIINRLQKTPSNTPAARQFAAELASVALSDTPTPALEAATTKGSTEILMEEVKTERISEATMNPVETDYLSTIQDQQDIVEALAKQAEDLTTDEKKPSVVQEYKDEFEELDRVLESARAAEQSTIPMINIPEVKEKEAEVIPSEAEIAAHKAEEKAYVDTIMEEYQQEIAAPKTQSPNKEEMSKSSSEVKAYVDSIMKEHQQEIATAKTQSPTRPEWTKPPLLAQFKSQNTESLESTLDELKKAGVNVASNMDQNNEVTVTIRGKIEKTEKAAEIVARIEPPVKLEKATPKFDEQLKSNHAAAAQEVVTLSKGN